MLIVIFDHSEWQRWKFIMLHECISTVPYHLNSREYIVNYVMADGAPGKICFYIWSFQCERSICLGITRAQMEVFPQVRRLMCWAHVGSIENLFLRRNGSRLILIFIICNFVFQISSLIMAMQLLMNKWSADPLLQQFQS